MNILNTKSSIKSMEHGKLIKFKVQGTENEIAVEIKQSDTLLQIYFSLKQQNQSLSSIRIFHKNKFINCTEDLQEVENNSTLFVFPNKPFLNPKLNHEMIKFCDELFYRQHYQNNFPTIDKEEIEEAKLLLEQNGFYLEDKEFENLLHENNFDINRLLRTFGVI